MLIIAINELINERTNKPSGLYTFCKYKKQVQGITSPDLWWFSKKKNSYNSVFLLL